jgi:hypothetical protein
VYVEGSNQTLDDISMGVTASVSDNLDMTGGYSYGRLRNLGNLPGETQSLSAFGMEMKYRF